MLINFIFIKNFFQILIVILFLNPVFSFGQVFGDYRSVATGNWNSIAIWQTFDAGGFWVPATVTPTAANANVITIQAAHTVTQNIPGLSIDQVVVDGTLKTMTTAALGSFTIANGAGVDLTINGTFWDLFTTGVITWTGTWQFGPTGTLLKTSASASNTWQASYNGGIATIPSTSNWILRKVAAAAPVLTTIGAFYGNLIIENNVAGIWNTSAGSTFQGAGGFPTIKGNLDIGGSGTSTVNFLNQHTNASPTLIQGNVLIRAGNIFANNGTGIEVQGNLTVDGTINYGVANARKIVFSGANAQSVLGAGTLNVYDCTLNKSGNTVTLNRAITIDNLMTFTSGIINTTATNLLTINTNGSVAGANNSSFTNGPVRYVGTNAFTYPIGKGSDYQPLSVDATSGGGGIFWTEAFQNGCAANCLATGYTGPNGTWTVTTLSPDEGCGPADSPNIWYVSGAECGNVAGACGTGCGTTDPSLHIGSTSLGDMGASFDNGGYCPLLGWPGTQSDARSESPSINCTGQSTITLSFNYIENGNGVLDNATLWYFDGTSWSQLIDLPKTLWGSCSPQGLWTAYSTILPVSANNNSNIKIGFRWINNDDMAGTDPSFAVDDITLSTTGSAVDFTCEYFHSNPQTPYGNTIVAGLDHISSCEYWILTRNAGTASKTVTLTWDANSCGVTSLPDLRVARYDGISTWQNEGNTATTGNTTTGTISSGVVGNFSPFTLASINVTNPLPIELLNFNAIYNENDVDLRWSTASEINNDYYTIERSIDAINFDNILTVDGAGNSSTLLKYFTKDTNPFYGTSYYRLKQTDYDKNYSYSKIISVYINKKSPLEIISINKETENTYNTLIHLGNNPSFNLEIINISGDVVFSSQYNYTSDYLIKINFNISDFEKGLYILKIFDRNDIQTKRFIVY